MIDDNFNTYIQFNIQFLFVITNAFIAKRKCGSQLVQSIYLYIKTIKMIIIFKFSSEIQNSILFFFCFDSSEFPLCCVFIPLYIKSNIQSFNHFSFFFFPWANISIKMMCTLCYIEERTKEWKMIKSWLDRLVPSIFLA